MAADRPGLARRLRPRSVRVRTTMAAVVVVGLALSVGAFALVVIMRVVLTNEVRNAARLRATDLATTLEAPGGRLPDLGTDDDVAIQILSGGAVTASGGVAPDDRPLARLALGSSTRVDVPGEDDDFLAVVEEASGDRVVLVARTLDDVDESTGIVAALLTAGIPVLLLVLGATTWRLTGRALAPVEGIRTEVEGIGAAQLHRRVPVPPGGDEIARLASTMNAMLDRLDAAATRQRRFVADASHELRSPVATLRAHAEATLAAPARASAPVLADVVLAEALRLQALVDDLLLLARADERDAAARARAVDLDDLVFEEAGRLRATGRVQVDTTAVSAGRVAGDADALRRVVRNLADNAARHARARVAFTLRREAGTVHLAVDDDGAGIPERERERVFERFVRLDEARARDGGGAGLGLAIVREVVGAAGGTSRAGDGPLGGARVEVELPALDDAVQAPFSAPVPASDPVPAPEEVP